MAAGRDERHDRDVQIIEVSPLGVRANVVTLDRPDSALEFVLFPMVHLGMPSFYRAVEDAVQRCDLAVLEGVRGHSNRGTLLTMTYRLGPLHRDSGLVLQPPLERSLTIPVLCPDLTGAEFDARYRRVGWGERLIMAVAAPVMAATMLLVGPQRLLAWQLRDLQLDDEPTPAQQTVDEAMDDLTAVLVDQRDKLVVHALGRIHQEHAQDQLRIAVVYGASHVPGIVHAMHAQYGYRARNGEWLTMFD